jgi:hypothetical protein
MMTQKHRAALRSIVLAGSFAALSAAGAAAQAAPTARQIIDRYVAATGGRAHLTAFNTRHQVAEMSIAAAGMTMNVETFQARPNKIFTRVEMPGMGSMTMGYDGTTAWANNPMQGPRVLAGPELAQVLQQADFDAALDPSRSFPTMEVVGGGDVGGVPCWRVRMVHSSGRELQNCFDKESGLLLGSTVHTASDMGEIEANVVYADYREFDGVKFPTRVTMIAGPQQIVTTVKSITHEAIPASTFELPAEIRALAH